MRARIVLSALAAICVWSLFIATQMHAAVVNPVGTPGQIAGTTTNDNAAAGNIGEFISSSIPVGSAVSLTTSVTANVTQVTLTAGDWDCRGNVSYNPAATTTTSAVSVALTTTSLTFPTNPAGGGETSLFTQNAANQPGILPIVPTRFSFAASGGTVFLIINASFAVSTETANGFLGCRRIR